jgi:hypothetical protein
MSDSSDDDMDMFPSLSELSQRAGDDEVPPVVVVEKGGRGFFDWALKLRNVCHAFGELPEKQESFELTDEMVDEVAAVSNQQMGAAGMMVHTVFAGWIAQMKDTRLEAIEEEKNGIPGRFIDCMDNITYMLRLYSRDGSAVARVPSKLNASMGTLRLDLGPVDTICITGAITAHYGIKNVCMTSSFKSMVLYIPGWGGRTYRGDRNNADLPGRHPLPGYDGTMDDKHKDSASGKVGWVLEECRKRSRNIAKAFRRGKITEAQATMIGDEPALFRAVTHPSIHDIQSQKDLTIILEDVIKEHCHRSQLVMVTLYHTGMCDWNDTTWTGHSTQIVINQVLNEICLQDGNCKAGDRVYTIYGDRTFTEFHQYIADFIEGELGDFMSANDSLGVLRTKPNGKGGNEVRGAYTFTGYCEEGMDFDNGGTCHYAGLLGTIDPIARASASHYMQRIIWVMQELVNRHWKVSSHHNEEAVEWSDIDKADIQAANKTLHELIYLPVHWLPSKCPDQAAVEYCEYNRYSKREHQSGSPSYMRYPEGTARGDDDFLHRILEKLRSMGGIGVPLVHQAPSGAERFAIYIDDAQFQEMHVRRGLFKTNLAWSDVFGNL